MTENISPPTPVSRDIAIVGVSALFPGSLDATGFWRDILEGNDLITDVPPTHWLLEDYYDPDPTVPDKTYARRGAFLPEVEFDAMAWGIPPSILPETDTSQILALIVAQQVLDDAAKGKLGEQSKDRMSVILGVTSGQELLGSMVSRLQRPVWVKALRESGVPEDEVETICARISSHYTDWNEATFPGLLGNVVAGRIANRLDLGGTNCVTDAACASTFSALSMGVNELMLGDSDVVIAGGVDTMNDIFMFMCFSKTPALSKSGDCRPFSDQADGTMLAEGLSMVALKRMEDAERDGDRIYAVIHGLASSSDGRSKSVYAPVSAGQAQALRRAYDQAGYDPGTVELMEAHGTGTIAGDAAEFLGLRTAFEESERSDAQWCALGSVKSQIGHAKAAAGAAGLFKAVMAVHHGVLPPTIKVETPNPELDIETSPFHLSTRSRPWVRDTSHPRRASVSSFGFGGSNFHLTLSEYEPREGGSASRAERLRAQGAELVVLSASSPDELVTAARELIEGCDLTGFLAWAAHRTQTTFDRSQPARLAVVARGESELAEKLEQAVSRIEDAPDEAFVRPGGVRYQNAPAAEGGLAFLFPGQGSQAVDMGSGIAMQNEAALDVWDRAAEHEWESGTKLHHVVYPPTAFTDEERAAQTARVSATEWAQPAIGTVSLSYLAVLRQLGLQADATAGHSYGEITALHAAGILSETDLLRVARRRGELMRDAASVPGAMTALSEPIERVEELLAGLPEDLRDQVVVANHNSPRQVVLSGPTAAIEQAEEALADGGVSCKRLQVATAFHSPVVAEASDAFGAFLEEVDFAESQIPVYSNTTGEPHARDAATLRQTIARQLASPVRFVDMVEAMYEGGARTFVEVGPGGIQTGLVGQILGDRPHVAVALEKRGKPDVGAFLDAIGALAVEGRALQLEALWSGFAVPEDPRDRTQPKLSIGITGANYGKPYPPAGGAKDLPAPNPARPEPAPAAPTAPAARSVEQSPQTEPSAQVEQGAPAPASPVAPIAPEAPAAPAASAPPASMDAASLQLALAAQRQAAETHAVYLQSLGQSHTAFLEAMSQGLAALQGQAAPALGTAVPAPQAQPLAPTRGAAPAPSWSPELPASGLPNLGAWAPAQPTGAAPAAGADFGFPATSGSGMAMAPPPEAAAPPPAPEAAAAPSAPAEAAPAAAPAAPSVDVQALMMEVVSEKTGYPVEMLGMEMELEADLGIDSIKRVEILSEMTTKAPGLPEVDTSVMGTLVTVGEVVDYMNDLLAESGAGVAAPSAPAEAVPAAAPATPSVDVRALMMEVVSEKTGYPVEMLGMEMELEADLGIDSIKRVEILSEMTTKAPGLPEVDTSVMGTLVTVGEVVGYMNDLLTQSGTAVAAPSAPAEAAPAAASAAPEAPSVDVQALMMEVVAEKTGYPVEMLGMEMELEADLGIDSIKRVEILSDMTTRAPGLPEVDTSVMGTLVTVGEVVDYMNDLLGAPPAGESSADAPADGAPATDTVPASSGSQLTLGRYVLEAMPRAPLGMAQGGLLSGGRVLVASGPDGLRAALVGELQERGVRAEACGELTPDQVQDITGLIFLGGLLDIDADGSGREVHRAAFRAARAASGALGRTNGSTGCFVTVQDTGGAFGLTEHRPHREWLSGLPGLVRTAAQEWPGVSAKAIDLEVAERNDAELAAALAEELLAGGPEFEVGLSADGARVVLRSVERDVVVGERALRPGAVVVSSGGGRGVTAATLIALAATESLRFVLLGRSRLEEEPAVCAGCEGDAELKRALLEDATSRGEKVSPADLGRQVSKILATREIRATMAAIEAAGSQARYVSADVTDTDALAAALQEVRSEWGPVAAIVHGAGVLADKEIAGKSDEQFDRVFDTKVLGLRALLEATASDPLDALVVFSSVAARCGNVGQCDYAMANEVLNKVALAESRRRRGMCVVKSLGWGPWEGGMVTPSLKAHFDALGVPLIPLAEGARMLVDELTDGSLPEVELVLGGEPVPNALAPADEPRRSSVDVLVGSRSHGYLSDHSIQGTPVVPVAMVIEWFARAAQAFEPGLELESIDEIEVVRGISLSDFEDRGHHFVVRCEHLSNGSGVIASLQLTDTEGQLHYRARAVLGRRDASHLEQAGQRARQLDGLEEWGSRAVYAADGVLFHGPGFQMIRRVEGISDTGVVADLHGVEGAGWPNGKGAPPWRTDPVALDGGLQLALLWAERVLGGASLPTSIAKVHLSDALPANGALRASLIGRQAEGSRSVSDVVFENADGEVVAQLEGVVTHLLPSGSSAAN